MDASGELCKSTSYDILLNNRTYFAQWRRLTTIQINGAIGSECDRLWKCYAGIVGEGTNSIERRKKWFGMMYLANEGRRCTSNRLVYPALEFGNSTKTSVDRIRKQSARPAGRVDILSSVTQLYLRRSRIRGC